MEIIKGGVTSAKGFMAAGAEAGIKYQGRKDMAMIYSEKPCTAAGTFTSNVVKAAPVMWDMKVVHESEYARAVVVNSGIANACTGEEGMKYCMETAEKAAQLLDIPADSVLVGSTGVIGMQLKMDKLTAGIEKLVPKLGKSENDGTLAAEAIMTTDTHSKQAAVRTEIGGKMVTVGGMSKGSGMIHPNMCTMLAYVTTDVCISRTMLQKALSADITDTFNMISVDGDTSTNDTLLLLANGEAGNAMITGENDDYRKFCEALHYVDETLAKMMAGDGEGASKLVECRVIDADTKDNARTLAKSVISSSLVKAAMYGNDSNYGRIMCALGYAGVKFDPSETDIWYEADGKKMLIMKNGTSVTYSEEEATGLLSGKAVTILCDMKMGSEEATAWGCDLTYDYVKINADYRS